MNLRNLTFKFPLKSTYLGIFLGIFLAEGYF